MKKFVVFLLTVFLFYNCSSQNYHDALIFDLKGNVKSCTVYKKDFLGDEFEESSRCGFENNGKFQSRHSTFTRDSQNRIIQQSYQFQLFEDEPKYTYFSNYEYEDNRLKKVTSWRIAEGTSNKERKQTDEYVYDSRGNIIKIIAVGDDGFRATTEYKYITFDDKGNWIEREWVSPLNGLDYAEKREIEYY